MADLYTRDQFRYMRFSESARGTVRQYQKSASALRYRVFLSHSHHDADIVENVGTWLSNLGVQLWVDWKDGTMPQSTNRETALRIKREIDSCGKMILLATSKGLSSRWVPWELGVADGVNGTDSVLIFPLKDQNMSFPGQEYVGIYPYIYRDANGPAVIFPSGRKAIWLKDWLEE
jgi:hypothetical protein